MEQLNRSGLEEDLSLAPPVTVRLLNYTSEGELLVASAARITVSKKSFGEASKMSRSEVEKWIKELIARSHGSPLEHSSYTFEATCSRVCSHQLVRHRHASYTQHSMRWSEGFLRKMALEACGRVREKCPARPLKREHYYVYARVLRKALEVLDSAPLVYIASIAFSLPPPYTLARIDRLARYARGLIAATANYYALLAEGETKENARLVVPQAVKTRIIFTMNARELVEVFLPLRMCVKAQWEIRLLAWSMRNILVEIHPLIFKWVGPRCVMLDNRARNAPCSLEDRIREKCGFIIERCPEKVPRDAIPSCLRASALHSLQFSKTLGTRDL